VDAAAPAGAAPTAEGARYDKEVSIDADTLEPMITYGTNPGMGMRTTTPCRIPRASPTAAA